MAIRIYKSGQGRYVRIGTAVAAALVNLVFCYYIGLLLERNVAGEFGYKAYLVYGIPGVVFATLGVLAFWYLNKPKIVDFLVATESEMKKVRWSGKAELWGSTTIIIVTVLLLAVFIYVADTFLIYLFGEGFGLW